MSALGPSFTAHMPPSLRQSGFRGATVTVVLTGDLVGLVGAEAGDRPVPLDHIAGLRAGFVQTTAGRYPELRLFLTDGGTLRFSPMADPGDAAAARRSYPDFVRSLAARLAGEGRLAGVEVGVDRGWTVVGTALIALPVVAMVTLAAWTWLDPPYAVAERWLARGFTSLLALLFVAFIVWFWRSCWPRRVADLAALDAGLPSR